MGGTGDLSVVIKGEVEGDSKVKKGVNEEELVDSMRALWIAHFAEVSATRSDHAILLYHAILQQKFF